MREDGFTCRHDGLVDGGLRVVARLPAAPPRPVTPGVAEGTVNRVTDGDLQIAVNGLWAAGAEAISVNGQRITETTAIRAMLLNPGPLRTAMRHQAMPGEDPQTLRTPEDLAPHFVRLASPGWTETGKLYDFPSDRVLAFQPPA